jgi:hypothetical protein
MINFSNSLLFTRPFERSSTFSAPNENFNERSQNRIDPREFLLQERRPDSYDSEAFKIEGFRFEVLGNIVHFQQNKKMQAIQDIYMKVIQGELHFSIDKKNWCPFGDFFEFNSTISFPLNEEGNPTEITVTFDVNTLS